MAITRLVSLLNDPLRCNTNLPKTTSIRGYYFGAQDRAAFVDVSCTQHVTHDCSEPDIIGDFFNDDETIRKLDLIHLESMSQYVVYWVEGPDYSTNQSLCDGWGLSFRGKILVMKRRSDGMRFAHMKRYHFLQFMECLKWWVTNFLQFDIQLTHIPAGWTVAHLLIKFAPPINQTRLESRRVTCRTM